MARYSAMIRVRLDDDDIAHALAVAAQQTTNVHRRRWRDTYDDASTARARRIGNLGELAVARAFGLQWHPSYVPQGNEPDVGVYEVKTASMLSTGYDDCLRIPAHRCVPHRYYVAVRQWNDSVHDVVGWCTGQDAHDWYPAVQEYPRRPPVHVIPYGDLRELETLP